MAFLEKVTSGSMHLDGEVMFDSNHPITLTAKQMRKNQLNMGFVFQQFNLFPQYTAMENVLLAPSLLAKERPDYKENKAQILAEIKEKALDALTIENKGNELNISIAYCPAVKHLKATGRKVSEWYRYTTEIVMDVLAQAIGAEFCMDSYDEENGAAKYHFSMK